MSLAKTPLAESLSTFQWKAVAIGKYPEGRTPEGLLYASAALCGEAAEAMVACDEFFRSWSYETRDALLLELGDVFWYLASASNQLELDLGGLKLEPRHSPDGDESTSGLAMRALTKLLVKAGLVANGAKKIVRWGRTLETERAGMAVLLEAAASSSLDVVHAMSWAIGQSDLAVLTTVLDMCLLKMQARKAAKGAV